MPFRSLLSSQGKESERSPPTERDNRNGSSADGVDRHHGTARAGRVLTLNSPPTESERETGGDEVGQHSGTSQAGRGLDLRAHRRVRRETQDGTAQICGLVKHKAHKQRGTVSLSKVTAKSGLAHYLARTAGVGAGSMSSTIQPIRRRVHLK